MKNAAQCAKKLTTLLKKLPEGEPPELSNEIGDDPVGQLVFSFLLIDSTTEKAAAAYRKLLDQVVDYNDLRVSMPHETAGYLGSRYPRATERCEQLRTALRNVYLREHDVTLERLKGLGKREVKKYIESLEGVCPYTASRLMLVSFDVHAIPVDEQLREQLVAAGAADEEATSAEVSAWLTRQIKAADGLTSHYAFQRWVEENPPKPKRKTTKTAKTTKTTKTSKKTAKATGRKKAAGRATASKGSTTRRAGSRSS